MALRIGINALYLIPGGVGGTEIYLRHLLQALHVVDDRNQYFVYVNKETDPELVPRADSFHLVRCPVAARHRPLRIIYEQTVLPALLRKHRISVVLNPGYTGPVAAPCPAVAVFHDLQHKVHPEFFRAAQLPFWIVLLWAAGRTSKRIIAVSPNTAADLSRYMPFAAAKISIVPHGVDSTFAEIAKRRRLRPGRTETAGITSGTKPFLLTVATLHPHKNLDRLIQAFAGFHATRPQYRLIVAGLRGFATTQIETLIRNLHLTDCVELTGWIPRADLYNLFEHADGFVAPSLFEGFGLTLAEALAAGIPTACSNISVSDAVAGTIAVRFDPHSVAAIRDAMHKVTGDRAFRELAQTAGPAQVRFLSWTRTAALTLEQLVNAARGTREDSGRTLSNAQSPPAR